MRTNPASPIPRALIAALVCAAPLVGCSSTTTFVQSDTTLGRVVVYRNGVAYFERSAHVTGDSLSLSVPADKIDDFLKSLTVVDAKTGAPAPVAFPTEAPTSATGLVDMKITLQGAAPHDIRLSYVTEAPSWKPSYRVVLGEGGMVKVEAWAIVDNTSGEDWQNVKLGVGSSSALSFRYDLRSIRVVQRETLHSDDLFAQAPPTGESTFMQQNGAYGGQRVLGDLSDESLALDDKDAEEERPVSVTKSSASKKPQTRYRSAPAADAGGAGRGASAGQPMPQQQAVSQLDSMTRTVQSTKNHVVIEGYADEGDGDKYAASLERANRAREQLVRNGVDPSRVVAVGRGEQQGRKGGVRVVEAPVVEAKAKAEGADAAPPPTEPIGTSHFESKVAMTVPRGTSAMVSILGAETKGEVVYLYDAESPRGNAQFPFRSVRLQNPTDSVLESGPVTVFGEGKFIGEGLCEPIPARSSAFVPFALDRQIQVERKDAEEDKIARVITVQRGVFSTEVRHTKRRTLTLRNRMDQVATVYVRHTVAEGYALEKSSRPGERLGSAHLFRADVPAKGEVELVIEEATPLFRTTDVRTQGGMDLVAAYLSSAAVEGPLKKAVADLLAIQREMANIQQRIETTREAMGEYRARMDELHAQVFTLRAVKTAGPLMKNLEKKLEEITDRLSKATIELVSQQELLMIARIRFQDAVADLSLEPKPALAPSAAGAAG